ncbi:MAG: OmpA family protein, partial [Mucilaginibacter sp.]
WFTASRYDTRQKKYLNNIYKIGAQNTLGAAFVKPGDAETGTYTEYGTPSLTQSGKRIYFTAWRKNGNKINLAIYYGQFVNNRWTTLVKLNSNVNTNGYNALQPFVTGDGKRLFFASDKPGGQGGMDLWVSNLDNDGNPLDATNLGNKINSPEDEAAPFYDAGNNKLIYSSKGFTGLGGFDFFESYNNKGQWGVPVNLGYPLNSSKDDLYYFEDPADNRRSYISSDRESDCCLNLFEVNYKQLFINGKISRCDSGKVLQGVKISLVDTTTNQVLNTVETSATGNYLFEIDNKKGYRLRIEKDGYFSKIIPVTLKGSDTLFNPLTCLQQYQVNKPIRIKNILYDFDKATLRPESKSDLDSLVKILADNPGFEIELASHTDSIGSDVYNLNLSQLRAQECVNYIISKGVNKDRLYAKGYGKNRPIAPNTFPDGTDNPAGRQLNRRTEFTVVKR